MKNIIPELFVENCKEALEYYQGVFKAEIKNVQTGDNNPAFKGLEGKVVHSELFINDACVIYLCDVLREEQSGRNMSMVLELESEEEINALYLALSQNGTIKFELQKTFWGAFHAVVVDCYGISWGLSYMPQK